MNKLSVIIPAYQAENSLQKCVESILQNDIELTVLIVNDGSTDETEKICRTLSEKYTNVMYWTRDNEGPGAAREFAIKKVDSEYITFVDSDDYLDSHTYDFVFSDMENDCDILEFGYRMINYSGIVVEEHPLIERYFKEDDCGLAYAEHSNMNNYLWNKIFKKKLFDKIVFPHLYAGEDASLLAQLFVYAKKYKVSKGVYYNYILTPDSLCRKPFSIKRLDNLTASCFIDQFYNCHAFHLTKYSRQKICSTAAILYCQIKKSSIEEADMLCDEMIYKYKSVRNKEGIIRLISHGSIKRRFLLLLFDISPLLCSFFFDKIGKN